MSWIKAHVITKSSGEVDALAKEVAKDGAVNNKNCRIWGASPPNVLHQQPLHSDYVTAWCGFTADFILEPFFFETLNPQSLKHAVSRVHGTVKSLVSKSYFIGTVMFADYCLFKQDGATPHTGAKSENYFVLTLARTVQYPELFRMPGMPVHPT
ncbi:hypothetical protein X975_13414, partial [Stegodyphus mimosarum]